VSFAILLFGSGAGGDLSLQLSDICLAHNIKYLTGLALAYELFGRRRTNSTTAASVWQALSRRSGSSD
jgi:hypothetical protein